MISIVPRCRVHDLLADGQPQPGAARTGSGQPVGLPEPLEDLRALVGRDAGAGVTDRHPGGAVVLCGRHEDGLAGVGESRRVADDVDEHLPEAVGVGLDPQSHR